MANTITSEEVNYLVFRYLQESGYVHTAFAFGHESTIYRSNIDGSQIPPGALLSFLQRGLSYAEIEDSLKDRKAGNAQDSTWQSPPTLMDVHNVLVNRKLIRQGMGDDKPGAGVNAVGSAMVNEKAAGKKPKLVSKEGMLDGTAGAASDGSTAGGATNNETAIPDKQTVVLRGHSNEVFACAWNPKSSVIATASGDGTCRMWAVPGLLLADAPASSSAAMTTMASPHVLEMNDASNASRKLVKPQACTCLDWNPSGTQLVAGSYSGLAKVWSDTGELIHTLSRHEGPLFGAKWSASGEHILTAGIDRTAIIWNASTGAETKVYSHHTKPILDLDWQDSETFALSSMDKTVSLCNIDKTEPVKIFRGHTDEVNSVKWNTRKVLLASGSDDKTVRVWNPDSDVPVFTFAEHTKEIYTIQWGCSESEHLIASSSFDTMVKVWDVQTGVCLHTLKKHLGAVYALAFSPDGAYLATGSADHQLLIWSVKEGKLARSFKGRSGIFDVSWKNTGDKMAACFSDGTCVILDPRQNMEVG